MEQDFGYYAIIPMYIMHDTRLKANSKLLYGQISSLTVKEGYCFASDVKLASDIGVSPNSINKFLNELETNGYIIRETKEKSLGRSRKIYLANTPNGVSQHAKWSVANTPNGVFIPLDKRRDKRRDIYSNESLIQIKDTYSEKINQGSQLTPKAKEKIKQRLKSYKPEQLLQAITNFSKNEWWMEHNSSRGIAWFFNSDDRIDQFLNLQSKEEQEKPRYKVISQL